MAKLESKARSDSDQRKRNLPKKPSAREATRNSSLGNRTEFAGRSRSGSSRKPGSATRCLLPSRVGRYQIVDELGSGGMGVVYKAVDPENGNHVALKTIRPDRAASATSRRRFLQEIDAVIQLDHPHILHIIEDGEENGVPYYVMEFVEGQTLDQYLASGHGRGIEWIVATAYKITLALQHIHERGILHLDVKPSNILIDGNGEPYLSDFGIARQIIQDPEALDDDSETAGTPLYMSPEQVLAPAQVDQRADIYSLGILLYEVLTGVRPFRGHGTEDVLTRVLFCDPISPRMLNGTLPIAVEKVILKAMDKCVTKRYQTAIELAQDLKRLMVRVAMQRRIHAHETAVDLPAVKRN